ncbi:hypothetical protein [Actinoplanes aureus]|uniref:Uncharacterized protein n=1 Tax=Actinoplanes aureus TaxID=2792083 RepID=A0A931CC19_9ACTN|nr:hypothetical protein [Actinoplanes aureus]MBG0564591.1 hypothetical protein [Actinoplanes aureus]
MTVLPHRDPGNNGNRHRRPVRRRLTHTVAPADPGTVWPRVETAVAGVPGLSLDGGEILGLTARSATVSAHLGGQPVVVRVLFNADGTWQPAALRLATVGRHRWPV